MKANIRKRARKRKCHHCSKLYRPDARHLRDQKYCSDPQCQKARQRKSWRRWFSDPKNRDYFKGQSNVNKTRRWRADHPQYWKRGQQGRGALQNTTSPQPIEDQGDTASLTVVALQNTILSQPALAVGLISQLTGSALPNAIAETSRRLVLLGQDILGNGPGSAKRGDRRYADNKTDPMSGASAPGTKSLQLG